MKKAIGFIVLTMLGLSGIFLILAVKEEMNGIALKKKAEYLAKRMQENYDDAIEHINGSKKPKMVKF